MSQALKYLDELVEAINDGKNFMSSKKKVVDMEIVMEIIGDLRNSLSEEVVPQLEKEVTTTPQTKTDELIDEQELTRLAYEKAKEIIENAKMTSKEIRSSANEYAAEALNDVERYLKDYLSAVRNDAAQLNGKKALKREIEIG